MAAPQPPPAGPKGPEAEPAKVAAQAAPQVTPTVSREAQQPVPAEAKPEVRQMPAARPGLIMAGEAPRGFSKKLALVIVGIIGIIVAVVLALCFLRGSGGRGDDR